MEKSEYPKRDQSSVLCTTSPLTVLAKSSSPIGVLLSRSEVAKISSQPPLIAYKRGTNVRDMLVRSKLRQPATRTPGATLCNQAKCGTCPFICTNTNVRGPECLMNIMKQLNCLTYIGYVIHCTKHPQFYICEAGCTLKLIPASKLTPGH